MRVEPTPEFNAMIVTLANQFKESFSVQVQNKNLSAPEMCSIGVSAGITIINSFLKCTNHRADALEMAQHTAQTLFKAVNHEFDKREKA
jgi:hypothetical protein